MKFGLPDVQHLLTSFVPCVYAHFLISLHDSHFPVEKLTF